MKSISKTMTQVSGESHGCLARCLMGIVLLVILCAALMAASCSPARERVNDGTDPMSADSGLLSNGFVSLDALGRAAVKALNGSSEEELYKLMVTEQEFRDVIFARTPDSLKAGFPCDLAWYRNSCDARPAIARKLEDFGGKNLCFLRTQVEDTLVFPGKTTYRNVVVVTVDSVEGRQIQIRFLNVVAMIGGRCKVVAFHK